MEEKEIATSPPQCIEQSYCPICYDKFYSHVVWQCRSCTAEYHFLCILEWLLRKYNCPCCRANERPIFSIMVNQEAFVILPTTPSELTLWLKHIRFLMRQSFQAAVESTGEAVVGYGIPAAIQILWTLVKHWLRFVLPHLLPILVLIFLYIFKILQLLVQVVEGQLMVLIWIASAPYLLITFISHHLKRFGHATFNVLLRWFEQMLKGELFVDTRTRTSAALLRIPFMARG